MSDRIQRTIEQYNKNALAYASKIQKRVPMKDIELFVKLVNPKGKILDVGCAAGRDTKILNDLGFEVVGADLSEKLLAVAEKKNPSIKFVLADIRKLPFPDENFAGVWANAVFHHLEKKDMIPALKELFRVLKKDGVLFLSTKSGRGVWKGKDQLSVGMEREFTLLSHSELGGLLKTVGFKKLSLETKKDLTRDIYWLRAFYRK